MVEEPATPLDIIERSERVVADAAKIVPVYRWLSLAAGVMTLINVAIFIARLFGYG